MTGLALPTENTQDGLELSSRVEQRIESDEQAEPSTALLNRQPTERDCEASGTVAADATSAPLTRTWQHRLIGIVGVLALLASGLVLGLYVVSFNHVRQGKRLNFLVVGDWGRDGRFNQSLVAAAMASEAQQTKPLFVISVGDNFYESGLTSAEDEQFTTSFSNVYADPHLQVPWFSILGNHDYGEMWNVSSMPVPSNCRELDSADCYYGPLHQLNATLTDRDWRWHCERFYQRTLAQGLIDIFFIDTSPAIQSYHHEVWASNRGGIHEASWEAQVLELQGRLATSNAKWKFVVGHHPVLNNHWRDTPELVTSLKPLLDRYAVQAYFSGHEHMLQHLHDANTHYVVSGGGSLTDYPLQLLESAASRMQHAGSGKPYLPPAAWHPQ